MAISWTTIEDAIQAWVVAATGLASSNVIWANQGGDMPAAPFVTIEKTIVRGFGLDWTDIVDAAVPAPGAEIEHHARGMRELVLTINAYGNAATGAGEPVAMLDTLAGALVLPTAHDALRAAGVGVGVIEPATSTSFAIPGMTEPRATTLVKAFIASDVSETGTFIETAAITEDPPIS